jgi:ATP-binding protein involved in chromosome partitioning
LLDAQSFFDTPGDERVYIFGRGGARRLAEQLGVPFLGEVPLNVFLRESGDEGQMEQALLPGSPARPYLLGVVEQLAAQISIRNIKTPKMPKLEILNG